jgi:hypothetical protein
MYCKMEGKPCNFLLENRSFNKLKINRITLSGY